MKTKVRLLVSMVVKGVLGFCLIGLLLFGGAGSWRYGNAWVLIGALFVLMAIMATVLLVKHPETLERRLRSREVESAQKIFTAVMGGLFVATFVLAGLDHRFGWSDVPPAVSVVALAVMVLGYIGYAVVVLQNSYASRIVEVQEGQALVSTGLYAVVRHPLYLACLLVFLPMPLILGSYIALIPMLALPAYLTLRIGNEETVLLAGLDGYSDYVHKTKYKLIPYIW